MNTKEYTHISISLGIGLLLLDLFNLFIQIGLIYFFFAVLFVIIARTNDWLDFKISSKHERKFLTHSPLSPLLICICFILGAFFTLINILLGIYVGFIIYIIFLSHSFLDALNPTGVPVFPNKYVHLKVTIPYDSIKYNLFISFIGLFMTFIAIMGFLLVI